MLRRLLALPLVAVALLAGAAAASADDTTVLPVGGTAVGAVQGTAGPAVFSLDADLAQRVEIAIDTPTTSALTARIYRPGAVQSGLPARKVLTLAQGVNRYPLTVDWPGRWTIEIAGSVDAPVSITATELAVGLTGELAGATTVDDASGLVTGATVIGSTLDPARPSSTHGRYFLVQAEAGDRVQLRVAATEGRPLRVEVLRPGTTDASAERDDPVGVLAVTDAGTLAFNADLAGQWIIRILPTPGAKGTTRPAPFTAELRSVEPRDPATTCADDITDIGLVDVRGCVTVRRASVVAHGPIAISGIAFVPLTDAPIRIDPKTIEVTSTGDYAVDIGGMRVLPATRYFLLDGTRTFTVPADTQLYGVPVTGRLTATWSLERGGSVAVTGTARLPGLGATGDLAFDASVERGLRHLRIRVAVDDLHGIAFSGTVRYTREVTATEFANVWHGGLTVAIGVASSAPDGELPAGIAGAAGALESRDGRLAYLRAAVNTRLPIGATGLFITKLGAGLRWNPYFSIDGTGAIALGPPVGEVSALAITGSAGWADGGSCPGTAAEGPRWYGGGKAVIASWFTIASLDACYQDGVTPYAVVTGQSGFGFADILTGTARFDGYVYGDQAMMIDGVGDLTIWGVGATGRVVLSDYGAAGCGATYVDLFGMKRRVEVGVERRWSDGVVKAAFTCPDFAPYVTVPVVRAARADGVPFTVPKDVDQVNLLVQGVNQGAPGVPAVEIIGPDGTVVAQSASTAAPTLAGAVFAPRPGTRAMQVALPIVQAGTYLIRGQAGSTVTSVQTSLPRPDAVVRARVLRENGIRMLRYSVSGLDGRRVRFVSTARGAGRVLGTVSTDAGTLPLRGVGAGRAAYRVTATVIDERGFAQAPVVVARYRVR
ncbi:MAG: hypothetical protein ACR2JV_08500 [Gaiellales bacterium]